MDLASIALALALVHADVLDFESGSVLRDMTVRDPPRTKEPELPHGLDVYAPHEDEAVTLLGSAQREWIDGPGN